ncbi:hydroxyisourate hydrolase [Pontibacter sp. HSC-36F09]|uniref:hydroxyisourate hydrolase n=1 Tax=Pontibacter sp. HSC-36F09 TaxID=2910966 RepID=UPI0020A03F70|nr:hydroxyisourate hydrolase [Pontibacter sp. HSC-36F09]MCP2044440.1 5-hydroxyisourate hydrolase [Pontibacter sp. HSC-36F09]
MRKLLLSLLFVFATSVAFARTNTYQLSSHIIDISTGTPAKGVPVRLEKLDEKTQAWKQIDEKITDENGRIKEFLSNKKDNKGVYRLRFLVADYFKNQKTESFYPFIEVVFQIKDNDHYHVPITLSPYGYATYRGN